MSHPCLTIIRDEHGALSAMLRSLSMLLAEHRRHGSLPDFSVLRAMLFYVDEFPEKLHHTKETELLFPKIRARCPEVAAVLDKLDRDHARGEKAIRDLEHDLLAFEVLGEARRTAFENAVDRYIDFYLSHMAIEEEQILPLALKHLTEEDWKELDEAFLANRDPLTGHEPPDLYRPLFSKIVMQAPAPIGLGPALN
ncbi:MAG: hemerythrin domain-containing protein [Piscinibacter sp.]|uniref:hemerythrin domain-containing protein n=1 Tax=Piscinibacter TaxID=1114981 RepID=UPI000FDD98C8|nr:MULTISPECIES: hemerythrin domain-containing protein [Piscinibacter]MCW5665425.1 hemerythrin domain-containing protein [Piscinibacter sp.]